MKLKEQMKGNVSSLSMYTGYGIHFPLEKIIESNIIAGIKQESG